MMDKIRVGNILNESLVNGDGIRDVIFFAGCNKNCRGCQNQELRRFDVGKEMSIEEIVNKVLEDKNMIDGVTLSGGDPLCQYTNCLALCKELKKHNINVWLYTGETYEEILASYQDIIYYVDVIVDGRYDETLKEDGLLYRGSSNQNIIYLEQGNIINKK